MWLAFTASILRHCKKDWSSIAGYLFYGEFNQIIMAVHFVKPCHILLVVPLLLDPSLVAHLFLHDVLPVVLHVFYLRFERIGG